MTTARRYLALVLSGMLIAAVALTNTNPTAEAANTAPFTARFATNANGAILSFGNNLLTCPDSSVPYCERGRAGSPYDNNNFAMVNLDADNDPSTVNSSSSTLQLPDGATVLFAGLYWGARLDGGSSGSAGNAARADRFSLKVPGAGSYQTLTGQMIAQYTSQANAYQAFYDVTSLVSQAGNGQYWGANIQTGTGYDRYAGWAITVAYTAPGYPLRNLTVFDGFNVVGSGYPLTIQVSGFTAPRDGPVDAQLSMIAYEGDLSQTGDYTLLNQTQLATGVSPGSNFFNSINSAAGASVTTRTPAHRNMLGYDIKNLGASGVIPNSATSARFSFSSSGDVYYPGMLALAINLYAPDFASSTKSAVNLTSTDGAKPGDRMQYTLTYANTGQDPATNVRACDPLPDGLTYVPESLELLAAPGRSDTPVSLDKGGSSVGSVSGGNVCVYLGRGATNTAGGTLMVGDITSFRFEAIIGDDAGGTTLRNIAHLNYLTGTTRVTGLFDTPPADTPVARKADVSINKSLTPSAAIAGFPEKATLVVTNAGPNLATGVTVSDPLPTDFTVRRVTWEIVNPSGGPSGTCPAPAAGTPVVCQVPDLPSGRSVEVAIEGAMASSSTATTLSNVASVATTSFDPDLSNNVAAASVPMTRQADLAITKTASKDNPAPGEMITWTLTVTNQCKDGPESCMSDAVDVVLSDSVQDPSKMILTEVTGGDGSTPGQGDVPVTCPAPPDTPPAAALAPRGFTCRVATQDGRLRPGETAVVQATAYIMGNLGGGETIKNTATVTSATYDPIPSDNRDEASVETGEPTSRIKLTKEGPATVVAGGRADYTIKVENLGPSDATNVQVEDRLSSAGLTADAATRFWTDRGEPCGTAGPTVSCVLAALPGPGPGGGQGAVATVRITGALLEAGPPSPLETITNTAEVTCGGG
ncbi:MAG: DUF11 domain-containing protein, partial [Bifidobacteriaceae bacterium]|nr:DUF11 domain-containing protein [Bifidobacteriaceae bacterium]